MSDGTASRGRPARSWDDKTLSFDTAAASAGKTAGSVLNMTDPNLKPFFDRGGKLLMYHGWNDRFVSSNFVCRAP